MYGNGGAKYLQIKSIFFLEMGDIKFIDVCEITSCFGASARKYIIVELSALS